MPQQVFKRDGRQEEFQLTKLRTSLEKAARDAGYPADRIFEVVEDVSAYVLEAIRGLETVETQSMRTLILDRLEESHPEVAAAWRKYDREIKGRED
jgi:transcriptional regulator NrdR family protein